jgi:hypothetical protein
MVTNNSFHPSRLLQCCLKSKGWNYFCMALYCLWQGVGHRSVVTWAVDCCIWTCTGCLLESLWFCAAVHYLRGAHSLLSEI